MMKHAYIVFTFSLFLTTQLFSAARDSGYRDSYLYADPILTAIKKGDDISGLIANASRLKETYMMSAAQHSLAAVQVLEQNKMPIDALYDGLTPLGYAAHAGKSDIVSYLCSRGSNPNVLMRRNATALHYASSNGNTDSIRELLKHGALLSAQDQHGKTPLHRALEAKKEAAALALIDAKAPLNTPDNTGKTPLHYAAQYNQTLLVKAMLRMGAKQTPDNIKNLPAAYATAPAILEILIPQALLDL